MAESHALYEKPLVVSCERTIRAGGGLVRYAGILSNSEWFVVMYHPPGSMPPQDLWTGTGHHQGRGTVQNVVEKG